MKKIVLAALVAAAFAPSLAMAEAGDIVVRVRAAHINPNEDSKLGSYLQGLAIGTGGSELKVDSNTIPEIDFSYYVTKNIALELILATGTRHDVKIAGAGGVGSENLGSVNLLPPTLTAQWHFNPDQMIDPYVGAGVNYTRFMDNKLHTNALASDIKVDRNSFGAALQAGVDINLKDGWLLNADVKYAWIDTDVKLANGTKIDSLDINPWVFGLGVGKKF